MRKIMGLMSELRAERMTAQGYSNERIREMRDMFRHADGLMSGVSDRTGMPGPLEEIMTSRDFEYAIMDFTSRLMWPAYQIKRFEFEPLVKPDTLQNFLPHLRYQDRGSLDDLEYVGAKAPPRPGSIDDADRKQWAVYVWQKQYDFHFAALVNDDIGYFNDKATQMGQAARRTLERYVSRMYTNATSILALTGRGALYSTTGRLTSARISTARMAFAQRLDARAAPITANLTYIVHHTGLIDTVRTIRASTLVPELATNAANVVAGDFVPIEDPHMAGTAPNLPWWAFTDWRRTNVVPLVLARWSAMPRPMVIRKKSDQETIGSIIGPGGGDVPPMYGDFATGNVVVKVMDVWGTFIDGSEGNLVDFRGAYYSSGTAP